MFGKDLMIVAGALAALATASCKSQSTTSDAPDAAAAPVAPTSAALPVDHVNSDELVEGTESAFGLKLPLGFHPTARVDKEVIAMGDAPRSKVVKYVLAHVSGGTRVDMADTTKLRDVTFATDPGRAFEVTVDLGPRFGTRITVREMIKAPPPSSMQPEEIYKQAGMDKYGRPLKPGK